MRLAGDRDAVRITRGAFGLATFDIRYDVTGRGPESGATVVTFDAVPDPVFR